MFVGGLFQTQNLPKEYQEVIDKLNSTLASLGVSVRHRITTHGFSLNITPEPLPWFAQIVACGLEGVKALCIQNELASIIRWRADAG